MSAPGTNKVDLEIRPDGVAIVTLDHFPVNTLTNAIQVGVEDACEEIVKKGAAVKAVVVRGAGNRAFCAGADVPDLNRKHDRYPKKPFMRYFEDIPHPVVAAIQGFALGGGLELSLGCNYRIASKTAAVGLPEINIGLLPGGEGTQRLPRIVGAEKALNFMLSGEHIPAKKAKELGVVDDVVDDKDLIDAACKMALRVASENPTNKGRKISELPPVKGDPALFAKAKKQMAVKRKNQPAAQRIIECVEAACFQEFEEGVKTEAKLFKTLLGSPEANALQYVFFSERAAAKVPGLKAKPAKVKKVAMIGAGLMAGGISMNFVERGIPVILLDREQKFLDHGLKVIQGHYARSVKKGSKSQAFVDKAMSLYSTTTKYEDLKDVDLVIEAVFEDMQLKKEIFKKLDEVCKPGCILASNTSFLSIDEMASATKRPEDVIGMHFFSPANVMQLLENVRGAKSSDRTIATAMAVGSKIGKIAVLAGNCHGFIANRMMQYYSQEAKIIMEEGAMPHEIDEIATKFGMPMGPFTMNDLTGLAIGFEARKRRGEVDPTRNAQDWLVENGRLGMKTSAGWYDYDENRTRKINQDVYNKINEVRKVVGKPQRQVSTQEVEERLFFSLMNEGFKILEEGFAMKPSDIDIALVYGYNYPRYKGGPMHLADVVGLPKVLATLEKYYQQYPKQAFKPSQLLVDCVNSKMSLAQFWAKNGAKYAAAKNNAKL